MVIHTLEENETRKEIEVQIWVQRGLQYEVEPSGKSHKRGIFESRPERRDCMNYLNQECLINYLHMFS